MYFWLEILKINFFFRFPSSLNSNLSQRVESRVYFCTWSILISKRNGTCIEHPHIQPIQLMNSSCVLCSATLPAVSRAPQRWYQSKLNQAICYQSKKRKNVTVQNAKESMSIEFSIKTISIKWVYISIFHWFSFVESCDWFILSIDWFSFIQRFSKYIHHAVLYL